MLGSDYNSVVLFRNNFKIYINCIHVGSFINNGVDRSRLRLADLMTSSV